MTAKKSSFPEKLLRIGVGKLEEKIAGSLSIQRKEILGELLVEFYEMLELDNNFCMGAENAQNTLNEILNYIETNKLIDEETLAAYRQTYQGITETYLKKALNSERTILKSGIAIPDKINTPVSDSRYAH